MAGKARHRQSVLVAVAVLVGAAHAAAAASPRIVATYFHRTLRCQTCLQIEALARYDVTEVMTDDVAAGRLAWRTVNFEAEETAHFAAEYGFDGPTLVITLEEDDGAVLAWIRLDRVWDLCDDVAAFDAYVLGVLEEYLAAASGAPDGRLPSRGGGAD